MQRTSQDYDITLDGNKFRLARGEDTAYTRQFRHSQVEESELFNPFLRGTMQSRPDFRSFIQSDWSGGQTWFKPTLPNSGGDTYFYSSLMDAWSKPGNLLPLNDFVQSTEANAKLNAWIVRAENQDIYTIWETSTTDATNADVAEWNTGGSTFSVNATVVGPNLSYDTHVHGMLYDVSDGYVYGLAGQDLKTASNGDVFRFNPTSGSSDSRWITGQEWAAGSAIAFFDGKIMVYDGDTIRSITKATPELTAVTDDGLGQDLSAIYGGIYWPIGGGEDPIHAGNVNNMVVGQDGLYYGKNIYSPSGSIEARIFRLNVTDSGTYLRRPIATLPQGMVLVGMTWHMDSLLMILSPDQQLMNANSVSIGYPHMQLWHYTQGSIGAIGSFDGQKAAGESPYAFTYKTGSVVYISSNQRLYAYDAVQGGLHQVVEYDSNIEGGLIGAAEEIMTGTKYVYVMLGFNTQALWQLPHHSNPKTGAWAAKSYTLESNYFEFGVPHETKQLRSVTALFEAGSANETYYIDVEADDAGSWTTVATMTCDNGGSPVTTDITASNVQGNRFRYRIRLQVDSGTNMPEFRSISFKAISGETIEVFQFVVDATEIVNLENEIQRPDDVFDQLVASARKNVEVALTDSFGKLTADAETSLGVRIDAATIEKNDRAEAKWTIQVTRTAV